MVAFDVCKSCGCDHTEACFEEEPVCGDCFAELSVALELENGNKYRNALAFALGDLIARVADGDFSEATSERVESLAALVRTIRNEY